MTNFWRTLVLLVFGIGAVWAATRIGGGPPTLRNALDDTSQADDPAAPAPPAEAAAPTDAEIEAQIRQAEIALGDRADPDKELPVDPLKADVAIALPSDI